MRLNLYLHEGGLVAYSELLIQLVENNYFKSGAGSVDEGSFKQVAVPSVTFRPLHDVPDHERRTEANPVLAQSSTVAIGFARKVVGEALRDWRRRSRARRWIETMEKEEGRAPQGHGGRSGHHAVTSGTDDPRTSYLGMSLLPIYKVS